MLSSGTFRIQNIASSGIRVRYPAIAASRTAAIQAVCYTSVLHLRGLAPKWQSPHLDGGTPPEVEREDVRATATTVVCREAAKPPRKRGNSPPALRLNQQCIAPMFHYWAIGDPDPNYPREAVPKPSSRTVCPPPVDLDPVTTTTTAAQACCTYASDALHLCITLQSR